MIKVKKDFNCILYDCNKGKEIDHFTAQQVTDENYGASFVGGGIASGSKAMSIMTEKRIEFEPLRYKIFIDGDSWMLTSVVPSKRRKLGSNVWRKTKTVYVLNLE